MKDLLFAISLAIGVSACSTSPKSDELTMIIGTYTHAGSEGIYTYKFDQENGTAKSLEVIPMENPSYLTLSANQQVMYVVSEQHDETASVSAFKFDKESGKAELMNSQLTYGEDPCYVATNGKIVTTANYSGGSMSVFPLHYDGSLEPVDTIFCGNIGGPDMSRQETPHVHCTVFSPDGKQLLATDFSADRILHFDVESASSKPHLKLENTPITADSGPRHIIFSHDGKYVYIISDSEYNFYKKMTTNELKQTIFEHESFKNNFISKKDGSKVFDPGVLLEPGEYNFGTFRKDGNVLNSFKDIEKVFCKEGDNSIHSKCKCCCR